MSLVQKALGLVKRFGAPVRFAAGIVLNAALPGSPAVVQLVEKVLECVHETAKDNYRFDESKLPACTSAEFRRIEEILDILGGDLQELLTKLAPLATVPDTALRVLEVTLQTDRNCQVAVTKLDVLAHRFDRLEEQNRLLLERQGHAHGILDEMLPLVRKIAGVPLTAPAALTTTTHESEEGSASARTGTPTQNPDSGFRPRMFRPVVRPMDDAFEPRQFRPITRPLENEFQPREFHPITRPLENS